ncbi:MAG: haloacid dehalogenase-like hydrolase [Terrimicrobiaceae bacterium]|nr:haloacid dehalogenase-like hydrolase [Terrimicrobiaceae bacterium]
MPAPSKARHLLLFDIDGTLLTSGGAGENALKDAMRDRFGIADDLAGITLAGATDALIARKLLEKHALAATSENVSALLDCYLHHLAGRMPRHRGTLLPGIVDLLERLADRSDECVLALLTGNLRRGAEIKLAHYGVWDYFEFGAFADDHHDRNELGRFARARALDRHGEEFPPERIFVIGDTPRDIECGRAIDAKTVAIATGNYPIAALEAHQPDFLFGDLSDTEAVLRALLPA